MKLHSNYRFAFVFKPFNCIVVSIWKPNLKVRLAKALWVNPVAMVLASHIHLVVAQIHAWLILTSVAEPQLVSVGAACKSKDLVTQTDAKSRSSHIDQLWSSLNRTSADLGVARPITYDHPLWVMWHHLLIRCMPGQSDNPIPRAHEIAYDAIFHASVKYHDAVLTLVAILLCLLYWNLWHKVQSLVLGICKHLLQKRFINGIFRHNNCTHHNSMLS